MAKKKFFRQKVNVARLPPVIRAKWTDSALWEGITAIPKQLLRISSQLFKGESGVEQLQVALTLADYRRPGMNPFPTVSFLSFLSGLDELVFMKRLEELRGMGFVSVKQVEDTIRFDLSGLIDEIVRRTHGESNIGSFNQRDIS